MVSTRRTCHRGLGTNRVCPLIANHAGGRALKEKGLGRGEPVPTRASQIRENDIPLLRLPDLTGKAAAGVVLEMSFLAPSSIVQEMGWPGLVRIEKEVPLERASADYVLFHADGSLTVLEAVGSGNDIELIVGIKKLCLVAELLGSSAPFRPVRKVLAVMGEDSLLLDYACELAGVQYLPLGSKDEHLALLEHMKNELGAARGAA